jgi:hypothetical protein
MRMPLRGGLKDEFFKALGNLSIRWGRRRLGQRPLLIVWMSLQLAIPRRVGLHQSPPPLHQLGPVSCRIVLADERFSSHSMRNSGQKRA